MLKQVREGTIHDAIEQVVTYLNKRLKEVSTINFPTASKRELNKYATVVGEMSLWRSYFQTNLTFALAEDQEDSDGPRPGLMSEEVDNFIHASRLAKEKQISSKVTRADVLASKANAREVTITD
jgi:hypothetical protein